MNINNIKEGMTVKNYPALCALLEEPQKPGSKSKGLQERHWRCFFEWERKGHQYTVTNIFDEPKHFVDGRSNGNRSIYCKHARQLFLSYLAYQSESIKIRDSTLHTIYVTTRQITKIIGTSRNKVSSSDYMLNRFAQAHKNTGLSSDTFHVFAGKLINKEREIAKSLLASLVSHKLIVSAERVILIQRPEDSEFVVPPPHILITINDAENAVLTELGAKSKPELFKKGKHNSYYQMTEKRIQNEHPHLIYRTFYAIVFDISKFDASSGYHLDNNALVAAKKNLNEAVIDFFSSGIKNKQAKYDFLPDKESLIDCPQCEENERLGRRFNICLICLPTTKDEVNYIQLKRIEKHQEILIDGLVRLKEHELELIYSS